MAVDDDNNELGKLVRKHREMKGWTQEELAEKIDVDQTLIGKIESGTRNAGRKTLVKLANVFNEDVEIFFRAQLGRKDMPQIEYGPEALSLAEKILKLAPRARRHVINQIDLLLKIPSESLAEQASEQAEETAHLVFDEARDTQEKQTAKRMKAKQQQKEREDKPVIPPARQTEEKK